MAGWWRCGRCAVMTPPGSRRCGAAWMPRPAACLPSWLICRPTVPVMLPSRGPATGPGSSPSRRARRDGSSVWRGMSAGQEIRPGPWCSSMPPGGAPGRHRAARRLAEAARHAGVRRLAGDVPRSDVAMLGLLEELGLEYQEQLTAASVHASFAVQETDAYLDAVLADQRAAARVSVAPFLRPRSIALVGASDKPGSIGALLLANLLASGFTGPVYPVNPRHQVIQGCPPTRTCPLAPSRQTWHWWPSPHRWWPGSWTRPPPGGPGGVRHLGRVRRGGWEGRVLQDELRRRARAAGVRLIGPNCMGLPAAGLIPGSMPPSARCSRRQAAWRSCPSPAGSGWSRRARRPRGRHRCG